MKFPIPIELRKSPSAAFLTLWYMQFWAKALNSSFIPKTILKNFLKIQFVGLKSASSRSSKALQWISESALEKISSLFFDCFPLRKVAPVTVNLGFFFDRMIEYSTALNRPIKQGEILLDVGSGYSFLPTYLGSHSYTISLDIDKTAMIFQRKVSKTMEKGISEKVDCVVADSTKLPFKDESFHRIFVVSTIEHIDRDNILAKESGRILRKGGRCFMSFPFSNLAVKPMVTPYFQRFYTKKMVLDRIVIPSLLSLEELSTVIKTSLCSFCNMIPGWFIFKDVLIYSTVFRLEMSLSKSKEGTLALINLVKK
jgi:ubiquinone/menaquinone biosynthesis C-methylase UbiE